MLKPKFERRERNRNRVMSKLSFNNVAIRAITAAAPSHVQVIDTEIRTNARFVAQMGIAQRHISVTEQTSLELGYVAVKDALDKAGWQTSDLDLLIFNTQFPDFNVGNSFLLQHYLSLRPDCLVFDQIVCCAALPYVLTTACTYLQQPNIKRAAIVLRTFGTKKIDFLEMAITSQSLPTKA